MINLVGLRLSDTCELGALSLGTRLGKSGRGTTDPEWQRVGRARIWRYVRYTTLLKAYSAEVKSVFNRGFAIARNLVSREMDPLHRFFFMGSPHYPTMPLAGRPRSTDHREGEATSRQYLDQGLALRNHRAARIDSPPTTQETTPARAPPTPTSAPSWPQSR